MLRPILLGLLVSLAGTTPWAVLVSLNGRYLPSIPWAVVPSALYLWVYWRYVNGAGWPRTTAEFRRASCRANPLEPDLWAGALLTGVVGLTALVAFMNVYGRIVPLATSDGGDVSHLSGITLAGWVVMSALVAGFGEESGFRGYMQGPIESRHGPVVAILITGVLFGFAHFSHPQVTLVMLPYYIAVAAVYGGLAYATNSIWPSIVLHAGGNMLYAFTSLMNPSPRLHASAHSTMSIWVTGPDARFWTACFLFAATAIAAAWAYRALRKSAVSDGSPGIARSS